MDYYLYKPKRFIYDVLHSYMQCHYKWNAEYFVSIRECSYSCSSWKNWHETKSSKWFCFKPNQETGNLIITTRFFLSLALVKEKNIFLILFILGTITISSTNISWYLLSWLLKLSQYKIGSPIFPWPSTLPLLYMLYHQKSNIIQTWKYFDNILSEQLVFNSSGHVRYLHDPLWRYEVCTYRIFCPTYMHIICLSTRWGYQNWFDLKEKMRKVWQIWREILREIVLWEAHREVMMSSFVFVLGHLEDKYWRTVNSDLQS